MAGRPPERADAARNRLRILAAARRILDRGGVDGLTMDALAVEAGVGKGTVFRRFGDRRGLLAALVDEDVREFQDRFLRGPPPLGPGASPRARLEAFLGGLIDLHADNLGPALAAETSSPAGHAQQTRGAFLLHVSALLSQLDADLDADVLAACLLNAVVPSLLLRFTRFGRVDRERLRRGTTQLLAGLTRGG